MLDLTQIRTFVTVAREGSFTRAASTLRYAQSSVTAQVQSLESQLGAPLFDRMPRALQLTQVGTGFLPHAEHLLAVAEEAVQSVQLNGAPSGKLTLSASESVLTYRLPRLLSRFQRSHPRVEIVLHPASVCEFGPPMQHGVDIGVSINEVIQDSQLITQVLRPEPVSIVVAADHPLARLRKVVAGDLIAHQLLLTEDSCSYRAVFERALHGAGTRPKHTLTFASVEAIKQCAIARMGVAVLPQMVVETNLRDGTLVALRWTPQPLCVYTQLVRRKDRWVSPAMLAFWQAATQTLTPPKKKA